jgi:tRNA uracil 4-sulfurtransferase
MADNNVFCIIRYGEIGLKGNNRPLFEKKLQDNLKLAMKLSNLSFKNVKRLNGRFLIDLGIVDVNKYSILAKVFGVTSISFAYEFAHDKLFEGIDYLLEGKKFKTFRVSTRKVNAFTEKGSIDYDCELGTYICDKYKAKVSLKTFDLNLNMEIIGNKFLLFLDKIIGIGGLPYAIEGRTIAYINDDKDKLAALLMMKRGCAIVVVGEADFSKYGVNPKIVTFDNKNINQFLNKIALETKCDSVVLGQTLDNFEKVSDLIEFRPLIGMDEEEIDMLIKKLL